MRRARDLILALGGAARANSYTRYHLAMFGQCSWNDVPAIPPEIMFLPSGGPFSVYDMSSWSRTIFVPLSIIYAHRPVVTLAAGSRRRRAVRADARGPVEPDRRRRRAATATDEAAIRSARRWRQFFGGVDRALKLGERLPFAARCAGAPSSARRDWMTARLRALRRPGRDLAGDDQLGDRASLPGPRRRQPAPAGRRWRALQRLFTDRGTAGLRVQPCLSPVWDTCLAASALLQAGEPGRRAGAAANRLVAARRGSRTAAATGPRRNRAAPGGWAFEFRNDFYPDVDDTAMALIALAGTRAADVARSRVAQRRGLAWLLGMQNRDGGWASFDRENDKRWLTYVPFADHNAMIDPSTPDITGRALECLSHFDGFDARHPTVRRAIAFLREPAARRRLVVRALGRELHLRHLAGAARPALHRRGHDPRLRPARGALADRSARTPTAAGARASRATTTPRRRASARRRPARPRGRSWASSPPAMADSGAVQAGVRYLLTARTAKGTWRQDQWTGTGFPGVFYLNYEYYRHYFPLMALAQYRRAVEPRAAAARGSAR